MKRKYIWVITCVLALLIVSLNFTLVLAVETNVSSYENNLDSMTTEELVEDMISICKNNSKDSVLIYHAEQLLKRIDDIDEVYIQNIIKDKTVPEEVRVTFIQLSEIKVNKNYDSWEKLYTDLLYNETENIEVRKNVVWLIDEESVLYDFIECHDGEVAAQVLKCLYCRDDENIDTVVGEIIKDASGADTWELRRALKIKGEEINSKGSEKEKIEFVRLCDEILKESKDSNLNNTIGILLSEYDNAEAFDIISKNDKIDMDVKNIVLSINEKDSARSTTTRLGNAVYRDGAGLNVDWHAGIMIAQNSQTSKCIAHITNSSNGVVKTTLSGFKGGESFYGIYRPKTGLTSAKRSAVASTALKLIDEDINYTLLQQVKYSSMSTTVTTKASPSKITHMRCDGVVEYCYEYNDIRIFGNDASWNIAINNTANVNSHYGAAITPSKQAKEYMTRVTTSEP